MQAAVISIATGILGIVAYYDLLTRRIPNTLSIAILALGMIRMALAADPVAVCHTLADTTLILVATFLLFWRGMIGGGDAKLIAAMTLLVGHHNLLGFLFLMSLFGGVLALLVLARDKLGPKLVRSSSAVNSTWSPEHEPAALGKSTVPYGLAIAAAGVFTLILTK